MKGTPIEPKPPGFNLQSLILNHPAHPKQARAYRRLKLVQPHERLNPREAQVADLLAEGWNPGRAADCLGLSLERLVYFSRRNRRKLRIESRTDIGHWELGFGDRKPPPKRRSRLDDDDLAGPCDPGIRKEMDRELIPLEVMDMTGTLNMADSSVMAEPSAVPQPSGLAGQPDLIPEINITDFKSLLAAGQVEDHIEPLDPLDTWFRNLRSADEILSTDWPEPVWAIPGLLPAGLTILAGAAKQGKSMLGLQLCLVISSEGQIFGQQVPKGRCLYLALEDPERRLKARMLLQGWTPGLQTDFLTVGSFTKRLGDLRKGGAERLGAWIQEAGYRLVIIDTLSRAIQGDHNDNREMTEWLAPLQELAHKQGCAILVIDHHRKRSGFDPDAIGDILGSTAKGAMADTVWGLYRERGKIGARLCITGREVSERTLHLLFDWQTGTWRLDEVDGLTTQQQEVREMIGELGNPRTIEIANALDKNRGTVHNQLEALEKKSLITRYGKRWQLTERNAAELLPCDPKTADNTDNNCNKIPSQPEML